MRSIIRNIAVLRIAVSLGVLGMVLGATNLALAKGEHATALHNMQEEGGDDLGGAATGGGDKGENGAARRPRRSE